MTPAHEAAVNPDHAAQMTALKKIEGQIRGIQKMVAEKRYCVDIMTQLHAIVGAILRVEDQILKTHLTHCVSQTLSEENEMEKTQKIDEIIVLLRKFRRSV
jgi:DNA-binding FrmR family transcriptional regulator